MVKTRKIRVLIAKPGLDGHDRGARALVYGLRERGMDVFYTGLRRTPEQIADRACEEKVDVIGLSSLAGAHKTLFPKVVQAVKEKGMDKVMIIGGGIIPPEDVPFLKEHGIKAIFSPKTLIETIYQYIEQNVVL